MREPVTQLDAIEYGTRPLMAFIPWNALIEEWHFDVLEYCQFRDEIERLKDESDSAAANGTELKVIECRDVLAFEPVGPARWLIEAAQDVHERTLARATLPHDADVSASLHDEIHTTECRHQNAPVRPTVLTVEILNLDDRISIEGHVWMIGQARYHARAMNDSAPKQFLERAAQYDLVPVSRRVLSDHLTPVLAYRRLVHGDARTDTSFLLESVEVGGSVGRFSMVAARPVLEVAAKRNTVTLVDHRDGTTRTETHADPLQAVRALTSEVRAAPAETPSPGGVFRGGWAGWLSYDTVRWLEPDAIGEHNAPTDDRDLPDMHLGLYESVVVFDHVEKTLSITCWADLRIASPEDAWLAAQQNIETTLATLAEESINLPAGSVDLESPITDGELPGTPSMPRGDFETAVEQCIEYIRAGDIFQIVPSQRFERVSDVDPFDVYRSLRVVNPSPYMIYMQSPDAILIASSPEILCKVEDGDVTSRPLAGTRRRGDDEAADVALERDLLSDEKERAEHSMLVDLARNDLGTVCQPGSVAVDRLMDVERYSHVMHISSTVSGRMKQGLDCWDALRRSLPVGTVSGAPKIRAMQIIDELEPVRRGPYAGGIGYVSFSGDLDVAIALRTIVVPASKPGPPWTYHLQAGAGVVLDSIPAKEYDETVAKAAALGRAIDLAEAARQ